MLESYLSLLSSHFHSEGLIKRSGERATVYGPFHAAVISYSLSTESEMDGMLSNLNSNIDYNNEVVRADSATQGMSLSSNIISQDDIPLIITTRKAFRARQYRMSQIGSLLQSSVYAAQSSHGPDCSYIKKKKKGISLYSSSITDGVICGDNDGCSEKNKTSVMPFATVGISLLCGTTSTLDLAKLLRLRRVSNNNGNTNTNYCSVKCTPSPQQSPRPSPNPVLSSPVLSPSVKENVNPQEEDPTSDSQTQQCLTATNKTKTSITHSKSQSDALIDSSDKSKGAKDTSVYSDSEPLHTNTEIENSVCRGGDKINEQKFVDGKCVVEHDMSKGTPRSIRPQRSIAMIGDKRERSSEDNADLNSIDIHKRPHADDADSTAFVTMSISKGSSPNGHCCDAAKDGAVDVDIPPAARPYRHTATNNSSHKLHMDTSLDVMSTPPPSSPASVWSASSTRSMQMVIDQEKWLRKEKELRLNQRAIRCLFSSDISREVESDIIVSDDEGAMLGDVRCFNANRKQNLSFSFTPLW